MSFLAVAHVGRGSPDPRRCRPQGSCPSRRFQQARGFRRGRPDASRSCSIPLASVELPSRAFPPRGADPALAGRCFLAGSSSDRLPAQNPRDRRDRFHRSRQLFALVPAVRRTRDAGAGTTDPCSHSPEDSGLAGERPARPLRSLAPPGGPFRDDPMPWPGWAARRCSPGVLALQSLLHHGSGSGLSRRRTLEGKALARTPPGARSSRLHSARSDSDPGLASPGSVDLEVYRTSSITVEQPPSSPSVLRALGAPVTSFAITPPGSVRSDLLVPPLRRHPAPPCPWRSNPIAGTRDRWTSKTLVWNRAPGPAPREAGWRPNPSRSSI